MEITPEFIQQLEADRDQLITSAQKAYDQMTADIEKRKKKRNDLFNQTNEQLIRYDERIKMAKELLGTSEEE